MSGKNLDELEQLRRSDARYHAVLLASAAILWIASPEGEFVERQPGWEEYTGQTWAEYQYSKWISAIHPDDRPQVTADWMGAVASSIERKGVYGAPGTGHGEPFRPAACPCATKPARLSSGSAR